MRYSLYLSLTQRRFTLVELMRARAVTYKYLSYLAVKWPDVKRCRMKDRRRTNRHQQSAGTQTFLSLSLPFSPPRRPVNKHTGRIERERTIGALFVDSAPFPCKPTVVYIRAYTPHSQTGEPTRRDKWISQSLYTSFVPRTRRNYMYCSS